MKTSKHNRLTNVIASVVAASSIVQIATASQVTLQQPTATFSQNFFGVNYSISKAIDGIINDDRGWAIAPSSSSTTIPAQTAAFETAFDVGFVPGSLITFTILQAHSNITGNPVARSFLSQLFSRTPRSTKSLVKIKPPSACNRWLS